MIRINEVGLKNVKYSDGVLRADLVHRNTVVGLVVDDGHGPVVSSASAGSRVGLAKLNKTQAEMYNHLGVQFVDTVYGALEHLTGDLLMINREVKEARREGRRTSTAVDDLVLYTIDTEHDGRVRRAVRCSLVGHGAKTELVGSLTKLVKVVPNITPASSFTIVVGEC